MSILNKKVLQVGADFLPDRIVTVRAAVELIFKGAAHAVEIDPGSKLHSVFEEFDTPSVIRLVNYVDIRKRRRESGKQRFRIFVRDGFRCQYCSHKFSPQELTLDHIIPKSRGGSDEPENLVAACVPCNQQKDDNTPDEARMPLRASPSALRFGLDKAALKHYAQERPDWEFYLCVKEKHADQYNSTA